MSTTIGNARLLARTAGRTLLAGVAAGALLVPGYALAQDRQAQADEAGVSNDIIVTANRREERLQDVPISITAISSESIRDAA